MSINKEEREELEALRRYKAENEGKAMQRAFARLETLMDAPHDPALSIRAFRVIAECLVAIRDEVKK